MTAKDTADRAAGAIDFTMMHATHDAFRRDLGRFTAASAAGTADAPGSVRAAAGRQRFLAALPAPVRAINRLLWEPRYRQRGLWKA